MSDLKYDWVVSQENRLASEECCLSEAEAQAEIEQDDLGIALERNTGLLDELPDAGKGTGERGFSGSQKSDPLDLLLETVWRRLQRPKLHAHVCSVCQLLRTCLIDPCEARRIEKVEREWKCFVCQERK